MRDQFAKSKFVPESTLGMPKIKHAAPVVKTAFLRVHPNKSIKFATTTSTRAMADVRAVKTKRIKNVVEIKRAPGSLAKSTGNVLKTSPGPLSGANPKVKITGKIVIAANSETTMIITPM